MEKSLLRRRWNEGTPALGTFVFSRDAATTDIAAHAKYDFVIIDLEHAPLDLQNVENHIRAAAANGISALVRISGADQSVIGRVLDLGADGIVYPHFGVDRSRTRGFADNLRYEPRGHRPSCASVRANGFSLIEFGGYVKHADANVVGVGLIEDVEVVKDLPGILRECQLDALMPGTGDLSTSMGLPGQPNHPEVRKVVDQTIDIAKSAGVKVGMYLRTPQEAQVWQSKQLDFFVYQLDLKILAVAYANAASGIRAAMRSPEKQ